MASLVWKDVDADKLGSTQRQGVDLCHAILEASSKGNLASMMDMLDVLSAIVIYEIFKGESDMAAAKHANNIMAIADRISDSLSARNRRP